MSPNNMDNRHAMLAAIIESSEDAIISKGLDSRITSWNSAATRIFGYTEQEAVGQLIYMLIPKERHAEEAMILAQLRAGKRLDHFETVRVAKSGKPLHVSLTISPIKNVHGEVIGASKIARDISKQKQHERRLEVINIVAKGIAGELNPEVIAEKVIDATTELAGAAFGAFFYNVRDAKGETYKLYALCGVDRAAFDKLGSPRNTELFRATFEGTDIICSDDITKDQRYGRNAPHQGMPEGHLPVTSYLAVPVVSKGGIVIGGLFFGHPQPAMFSNEHEKLVSAIASQAAVALDNANLYKEIQTLNDNKDQFIAFASHELKTPLTTIKGYVQFADSADLRVKDVYPKLNKQLLRLEGLINDLLDLSAIQSGQLDLQFAKASLQELIRESLDTLSAANPVQLELPQDEVIVTVDGHKIVQVLINLLGNAAKYSNPDSVIKVTARQLGDQIQISVQDFGMGISSEHLDKVFNQYYRITPGAGAAKGMGLGLYISKIIIEGHGGRIWAESDGKTGSTFSLQFPVERFKPQS